jgi:hypothetical protein
LSARFIAAMAHRRLEVAERDQEARHPLVVGEDRSVRAVRLDPEVMVPAKERRVDDDPRLHRGAAGKER